MYTQDNLQKLNTCEQNDWIYEINKLENVNNNIKNPNNYTKIELESYYLSYDDLKNYNQLITDQQPITKYFSSDSANLWFNYLNDISINNTIYNYNVLSNNLYVSEERINSSKIGKLKLDSGSLDFFYDL